MSDFLCDIASKDHDKTVLVYDINDDRCRYHRRQTKGQNKDLLKSFPCPLSFSYLYPALFSMHCQASLDSAKKGRMEQRVRCAAQDQGLEFTLSCRQRPNSIANFFGKYISRLINRFIPIEQREFLVDYKVTRVNKSCPLGIKSGDTFTFNVDNLDEICPAAFHSVYPFGQLMEKKCLLGCPDYRTHVKFSANNEQPADAPGMPCDTYPIKIRLKKVFGDFNVPMNIGVWYSADELIEALHLQCLTSFYIAFPYLLALSTGGQLGYLFNDRNKAGICCPNDACQVNYAVSKDENDKYSYQCIKAHPLCPRKLKEGDIVDLENFEGRIPFYSGLHDLFIVMKKYEQYPNSTPQGNFQMTTTFGDSRLEWEISFAAEEGLFDLKSGKFAYSLKNGENPYQVPASAFNLPQEEEDNLSLLNFVLVSGESPCFTNMADADCLLQTLSLAGEAYRINTPAVPYICVVAKHGNPCGFGISRTNPSEAIDRAMFGNPRSVWGGEMAVNFNIDAILAKTIFKSEKREKLLGEAAWMLDLVMAPSFSGEAISLLGVRQNRKLMQNPALNAPFLKKAKYDYRFIRGGFLRQPPANYCLDIKKVQCEGNSLSPMELDSLIIAWATVFSSNHGGNEVALAKDSALLGVGGGPSTLEAARTAVLRSQECGHNTKRSIFAADAFFPFTDAPSVLCEAGAIAGCVPAGGRQGKEVSSFFKEHGVTIMYLPPQYRGFCRH